MIKVLKDLIDLKKFSVILFFIPYIVFVLPRIVQSPFFSSCKFLLTVLLLLAADIVFKKVQSSNRSFVRVGSLFFISFLTVLVYANTVFHQVKLFLSRHFFTVRDSALYLTLLLMIFILLISFIRRQPVFYLFLNRMLLIFSLIVLFSNFTATARNHNLAGFTAAKKSISFHTDTIAAKRILLVIMDEYSSPDQLSANLMDTGIYDLSNYLKGSGWVVKNNFASLETYTLNSISSLFNYNLSISGQYKSASPFTTQKFMLHSAFGSSMAQKGLPVKSLSFFPLGNEKPFYPLYREEMPENFTALFLQYSILPSIIMAYPSFAGPFFPIKNYFKATSDYNHGLFNQIGKLLDPNHAWKGFTYVHLMMPHGPVFFEGSINHGTDYTLPVYFEYWKFANKKIMGLLKSAGDNKNLRIIISGDHGYRNDNRIDPHDTFSAFYGFDSAEVNKINQVQDIGLLINAYLKKQK